MDICHQKSVIPKTLPETFSSLDNKNRVGEAWVQRTDTFMVQAEEESVMKTCYYKRSWRVQPDRDSKEK